MIVISSSSHSGSKAPDLLLLPLQIQLFFLLFCFVDPSPSCVSFISSLHFLSLLHRRLFLSSSLFPPILPSAFSPFSTVSFLTPATGVYTITPTTVVCPQLLQQWSLELWTLHVHPPTSHLHWMTQSLRNPKSSQARWVSSPFCACHPNKWHKSETHSPFLCLLPREGSPVMKSPWALSFHHSLRPRGTKGTWSPNSSLSFPLEASCLWKQVAPISAW